MNVSDHAKGDLIMNDHSMSSLQSNTAYHREEMRLLSSVHSKAGQIKIDLNNHASVIPRAS